MDKIHEIEELLENMTPIEKELVVYRIINLIGRVNDDSTGFDDYFFEKEIDTDFLVCLSKLANTKLSNILCSYSLRNNDLEYKKIYKESLIHLNQVLENYKKLAHELKLENALDISNLYTYMLWNGYYSATKTHNYSLKNRLLLPNMNSFDIVRGNGVCLGYSELLHRYLSKFDKKSACLYCLVKNEKDIDFAYRPNIDRKVNNSILVSEFSTFMRFVLRGIIKNIGNHAINLIEENGKIYCYDSTNLAALNIEDSTKASLVNGKGDYELKAKTSIIIDYKNDPYGLREKILLDNYAQEGITRREYIDSFENIMQLTRDNKKLLDSAYDSVYDDLSFINNQTNEIGGHKQVSKMIKLSKKQ